MFIKTEYVEFVFTHDDAEFVIKEVEVAKYAKTMVTKDNRMEFDTQQIVDSIMKDCIVSWKGVKKIEDKTDLECTDANKVILPLDLKMLIMEELEKRRTMQTEKKMS